MWVRDKNGCNVCVSHKFGKDGYPIINTGVKFTSIHREIYEQQWGPIAPGLVIRHLCHNRACINIAHLKSGTPKENALDTVLAGRQARGEKSGIAKLTKEKVLEILGNPKVPTRVYAQRFGVTEMTISNVRRGRTWRQ